MYTLVEDAVASLDSPKRAKQPSEVTDVQAVRTTKKICNLARNDFLKSRSEDSFPSGDTGYSALWHVGCESHPAHSSLLHDCATIPCSVLCYGIQCCRTTHAKVISHCCP